MFARLGTLRLSPSRARRPRLDHRPRAARRHRRRGRLRVHQQVRAARRGRVQARHRSARPVLRRRRRRPERRRSSSTRPTVRSTDPAVESAVSAYLDEVAKVPGVAEVSSPYSEAGARADRPAGRRGRQDRLRHHPVPRRRLAGRGQGHRQARSRISRPTIHGVQIEYGGQGFAKFEAPVVRAARPRLRHHHPDRWRSARCWPWACRSAWPSAGIGAGTTCAHAAEQRRSRCPTSPPRSA